MSTLRKSIIAVVIIAAAAAVLGFTAPGHRVLHTLGFATACGSSDGCGD